MTDNNSYDEDNVLADNPPIPSMQMVETSSYNPLEGMEKISTIDPKTTYTINSTEK